MQDACHHELSKYDLCSSVAHWLERLTGVRNVMGSIPLGDSEFSLSHARDMLNIPSFLLSKSVCNFFSK